MNPYDPVIGLPTPRITAIQWAEYSDELKRIIENATLNLLTAYEIVICHGPGAAQIFIAEFEKCYKEHGLHDMAVKHAHNAVHAALEGDK